MPPVLSRLPAVEFFNSIDVADVITIEPSKGTEFTEFEERLRQDREETRKQIKEEAGDRLEALLAELGNDLFRLLQGARLAFNSSNPDHFGMLLSHIGNYSHMSSTGWPLMIR